MRSFIERYDQNCDRERKLSQDRPATQTCSTALRTAERVPRPPESRLPPAPYRMAVGGDSEEASPMSHLKSILSQVDSLDRAVAGMSVNRPRTVEVDSPNVPRSGHTRKLGKASGRRIRGGNLSLDRSCSRRIRTPLMADMFDKRTHNDGMHGLPVRRSTRPEMWSGHLAFMAVRRRQDIGGLAPLASPELMNSSMIDVTPLT
jgi:hypothetical protein